MCEVNINIYRLRKTSITWSFCCYTDASEGKALVDRVMTSVKGGTLSAAALMRANLNKEGLMDIATYQTWAQSIVDGPALIKSEVGMIDWQS